MFNEDRSDEISRNNEEDIDSDKSTCEYLQSCVENYHNANRDRSRSVYVRAIASWWSVVFFYYPNWLRNCIVLNLNLGHWRAVRFLKILFRLSNLSLGNSVFQKMPALIRNKRNLKNKSLFSIKNQRANKRSWQISANKRASSIRKKDN